MEKNNFLIEQNNHENEQIYRHLIESAMFGILIHDLNNIYYSNQYLKDILGYNEIDFKKGLRIYDILTPSSKDQYYEITKKSLEVKSNFCDTITLELQSINGEIFIFDTTITSFLYNGEYALQITCVDVTQRVQNEKSLQNNMKHLELSANKYKHLVKSMNDGFIIVDSGLKLLDYNSAFAHILEYEVEELENINILELVATQKDKELLLVNIEKRLQGLNDSYELSFLSKSGKKVPTYVNPTPYVDVNGNIIGSYTVIQDLSQIKQAQEKISYQTNLLENVNEGIIVTDEFNIITYWNAGAEKLFEFSREQVLNRNLLNFIPSYNKDLTNLIYHNIGQNQYWQQDIEFTTKSGEIKYARISGAPLRTSEDTLSGTIAIASDLTALINSRKDAEIANLSKTAFLAKISHDIRTPMIGIVGANDLLKLENLTFYQKELVSTIQQCSEQLLDLINDVLDLSKIETGNINLNNNTFNLSDLISECMSTIDDRVKPQNVELITKIDSSVPSFLIGDDLQLKRIIVNLLSNAIKFTDNGYIEIAASHYQKTTNDKSNIWVLISVEDTGEGIPPTQLEKIFDAYHQAENNINIGSGLGLSICKQLCEMMGGKIWVDSELGIGTKFFCLIPFKIGAEPEEELMNANTDNIINTEIYFKNILLVEDNEVNKKIISYMLKKANFNVTIASNGKECLEILEKSNDYDLILMDMQMPVMDGYETVQHIKNNNNYNNIPVIALTAFASEDDTNKCLVAGCDYYLSKPISFKELYKALRMFVKSDKSKNNLNDNHDLLAHLLPEFIESMEELLNQLYDAIEHNDLENIKSISHDIKGTAGLYGYKELSSIADKLNTLTRNNKTEFLNSLSNQLYKNLEKIKTSRKD
ncbi:hypothetical protein SYNTR_0999 [Candidatus Syntrophocurvum alkaliphilum]|uniref:Circadian input-output histidine kinase CikA n=1 Tax=Candidatus Syntrophocurvum alkaliphilum TaxID=2293317 RepID=A0A6I6DF23_9FIRM|nr:PAS domain S-box protein [Candidatus Syntrophocurvum alkaliphilum]QGT99592.1 hypothetical protein SYNTR_0999 [Candidatus Syntrophocurvum alkaliphilum]